MLTNRTPRPTKPLRPAPEPDRPRPDSDPSVEQIKAVCSKHSIPCGKPDSLKRFVRALHDNKYFAMDFWSLVARVMDFWSLVASLTDQDRSADPDRLLAAIVQGVTGRSLDDVNASSTIQRLLVREIAGLLAGEDVQTPLPPRPVQSAHPSDRSGRFAPFRQDAVPRRGAVPPPPSAPSSVPGDQPRLVLRSDTPFAAAMDRNLREREPDLNPPKSNTEPQIAIPPSACAEESADSYFVSRKIADGILLALAAAGVLMYDSNWKLLGTPTHPQYAAAFAERNPAAAPSAASINGSQSYFTAHPSNGPAGPLPAVAPHNPNPGPAAALPESQPITPHKPAPIAVATTRPPTVVTANPKLHAEAQIAVPESEMKQHLISSRVPIFPAGVHGPVVIQAIVTARGGVEPVSFVSGNPALARAAMAAVATWRYRPYRQNGDPVNVYTTISVDSAGDN